MDGSVELWGRRDEAHRVSLHSRGFWKLLSLLCPLARSENRGADPDVMGPEVQVFEWPCLRKSMQVYNCTTECGVWEGGLKLH